MICKHCKKNKEEKKFSKKEIKNGTLKCKTCHKSSYDTLYRQKNDTKIKLNAKIYRGNENNKEKNKLYCREYYKINKDLILAKMCIYYKNNKDARLLYAKKYREENFEKIKDYNKKTQNERNTKRREKWANDIKYREKRIEQSKIYRKNNPEKVKKYRYKYYKEHREDILLYAKAYSKKYYIDNKDNIIIKTKEYRKGHKNKIKEYQKQWHQNKMKNAPSYKMSKMISSHFNKMFKRLKYKSSSSFEEFIKIIPYSYEGLVSDIESKFEWWMNWNNYGKYNSQTWDDNDYNTWTWNIDHIIPQSDLPIISMHDENFSKCWSLQNLRPYSSKQNSIDGATRIRHKN